MSLRKKQSEFASMVPRLIDKAFEMGFEVTLGDCYRDIRCKYGSSKTFHRKRLAIDLNLFSDGEYLQTTEAHRPLGEWWESVGGTWGGRFRIPDGNHYSWGE
jgi:hypothetical protein